MQIECDVLRQSLFLLVSALGLLVNQLYDEITKTLADDNDVIPNNATFPGSDVITKVIDARKNHTSNLTTVLEASERVKCQRGYFPEYDTSLWDENKSGSNVRRLVYNTSVPAQDPRYECIKVALDANHSFVVCVDERKNRARHWDQAQIEHLYAWLSRDRQLGYLDLSGGNGFYALAAAAMKRTAVVVESDEMNMKRIHKGVQLSHLEHHVLLVNARVSNHDINQTCDKDCGGDGVRNVSVERILDLVHQKKVVLRVHLNSAIMDSLLQSEEFFKMLCITFIITEAKVKDYPLDSKVLFMQLASLLVNEQDYRPFTENGIALTLNTVLEWPVTVYWVAGANLAGKGKQN